MIVAFLAFAAIVSGVIMLLWNWLIPDLFSGPVITFWQAAGLFLLSKILFGFGKGSWKSHKGKYKHHMRPEDKEYFRKRFMEKCGWDETHQTTNSPDSNDKTQNAETNET